MKSFIVMLVLFFTIFFIISRAEEKAEQRFNENTLDKDYLIVRELSETTLDSLLRDRNGKILLLNVWATWCMPCREEFPDLVKLAKSYDANMVDIVGISADFPDEIDSKIVPFLKEQEVNFPNFVQNFEKQEDFINRLNEEWQGALPATFIYDSSGNQQRYLLGKQSYNSLRRAIEEVKRDF